jgi:Cys-tRNA(Pro)/Cys-tRNA(Cys) deacylase
MPDTNAIKWLRAQNASFDVLEYEFERVGAEKAAEAVGKPLDATCKTLVVEASGKRFWIAIIPGDQRVDTRKLAHATGAAQADLAEQAEAEKITGYLVGGISPFALRRKLPVLIEESLLALDRIIVNGGRRGVLLEMATEDVIRLLEATSADICK